MADQSDCFFAFSDVVEQLLSHFFVPLHEQSLQLEITYLTDHIQAVFLWRVGGRSLSILWSIRQKPTFIFGDFGYIRFFFELFENLFVVGRDESC